MKLRLKYVGIGLFLAGLLFTLNSQFEFISSGLPTETSNEKALEKKEHELENLHKQLKAFNEEKNTSETNDNKGQEDNASNSSKDSSETDKNTNKENDVVSATVIIYENMSLYEIGQQVEDLNLIENGRQLELYLSKPEYARSVQKGSFELSSDMTIEEMANIITAKKKQ